MSKISPREIQLMRLAYAAAKSSNIQSFDEWIKTPLKDIKGFSNEDYAQFYADQNLDDRNDGGRLESPARVGSVNFGRGIECRLVVEKAQRDHKYWESGAEDRMKSAELELIKNRLSLKESKVCELSSDNIQLEAILAERDSEIARFKERYESTPERGLKAVMLRHQLSFHGSVDAIAIIQSPNKNIAVCSEMGPCCGTFTITAEDLK